MRKTTTFALAAILAIASGEAAPAPRPAPAMSCDAFKQRLAEKIAKDGDRVLAPAFSHEAVAVAWMSHVRYEFSNIDGVSGRLTCGASNGHFVIVDMASDVPDASETTVARI